MVSVNSLDQASPPKQASLNSRKPYQKSSIERIRLMPEEAVLAGCKVIGTSGPGILGGCIEDSTPCQATNFS